MEDERYWADVAKNAKDLVSKLLDKNPHTRPNIKEVLSHHWLNHDTNKDEISQSRTNAIFNSVETLNENYHEEFRS